MSAPPEAVAMRPVGGLRWLPVTLVVLVLDQASKAWMVTHLRELQIWRVLPVVFS